MPGTLIKSRPVGLAFARVRTTLSNAAICSRSCRQATSMGRTIGAQVVAIGVNAPTRRSNGRPRIAPGSIPNVLSTPRMVRCTGDGSCGR